MRTIGIVLARLDSKRLPAKALKDLLGRPLISYAIERARKVPSLYDVVIATSMRPVDDELVEYGRRSGITVFRGSTENVAHRCLECARRYKADFFVRLNGDSPFVDSVLVEEGIGLAASQPTPDLVTNLVGRTFPYGVSVEIVNVVTIERIVPSMSADEAEHVTKRFYDRPEDFSLERMRSPFPHLAAARLVVDTPEDMARFVDVADELGPRVTVAPYQEVAELYLSRAASGAFVSVPGKP
jgi:spore coat polysaccharide biosynthesis protein SpsF